jgi:UPF0271 protein
VADAVAEYRPGLPLYGQGGSCMEAAAAAAGVPFVREAFSDRAYHTNGALVDRRRADAMVVSPAEVVDRVARMATDGVVQSIEGDEVVLDPGTICFHADTPGVIAFLQGARSRLGALGIQVEATR